MLSIIARTGGRQDFERSYQGDLRLGSDGLRHRREGGLHHANLYGAETAAGGIRQREEVLARIRRISTPRQVRLPRLCRRGARPGQREIALTISWALPTERPLLCGGRPALATTFTRHMAC